MSAPRKADSPPVTSAALPNELGAAELRLRPASDGLSLDLQPRRAGWRYLGFQVVGLRADQRLALPSDDQEMGVVVIGGGGLLVDTKGPTLELTGRASPFEGLPWAAYLPPGCSASLIGRPLRLDSPVVTAIATAPATGRKGVSDNPFRITPDGVRIEIRGGGNATRQINHILTPEAPADRLELVEVLTPSGNWSSWPPHKHDRDAMPGEAVLEEIYYYQFRRPEAWGLQRLYRADRSRDCLWEVRHGELVLVPDGYHPFVASHGDDAYYLNALAGDRRTMACSFDPDLDWVRATWAGMAPDPRVPIVGG